MLFIRLNIDPHLPGTHRAIGPVHSEAGIDDVQMDFDRFDGLDRSLAAHRDCVSFDHILKAQCVALTAQQRRKKHKNEGYLGKMTVSECNHPI
jgi:hypothetical protein